MVIFEGFHDHAPADTVFLDPDHCFKGFFIYYEYSYIQPRMVHENVRQSFISQCFLVYYRRYHCCYREAVAFCWRPIVFVCHQAVLLGVIRMYSCILCVRRPCMCCTGVCTEHVQRSTRLVRSVYIVVDNDVHSDHYVV